MPPASTERRREVPAVTRAIAVLRYLGRADAPVGVNRIARDLGLVPSTCLHILRVLADEGLVTADPVSKRYAIGVGILAIARGAILRNDFASLIEPELTALSAEFGGTAVATQLVASDHMVVVALSRAQQPFRLQVDLGSRFPALISATGRCHAAFNRADLPPARLKTLFSQLQWDHPPTFDAWTREVAQARLDGYAVDRSAYIDGVTIVAVPFLDAAGRMTHSMVMIDITARLDAISVPAIVDRMLQARNRVRDCIIERR